MKFLLPVLISGVLTDNILLSGLLGLEEVTKKDSSLLEILKKCGIVAALVFLSTVVSYPLAGWVLIPIGAEVLVPLLCILVICGISFAALTLTKMFLPSVYGLLARYKEVITCSALVLGICLRPYGGEAALGYPEALVYSVAAMAGFLLVSVIFWSLRGFLNSEDLPKAVRGLPMTLLVAALLSMAFQGFVGM